MEDQILLNFHNYKCNTFMNRLVWIQGKLTATKYLPFEQNLKHTIFFIKIN
jgi:hypothetical protein